MCPVLDKVLRLAQFRLSGNLFEWEQSKFLPEQMKHELSDSSAFPGKHPRHQKAHLKSIYSYSTLWNVLWILSLNFNCWPLALYMCFMVMDKKWVPTLERSQVSIFPGKFTSRVLEGRLWPVGAGHQKEQGSFHPGQWTRPLCLQSYLRGRVSLTFHFMCL